MTLLEMADLLANSEAQTRVQMAVLSVAAIVLVEDKATEKHAERALWAVSVMSGDLGTDMRVFRYLAAQSDPTTILASDATLKTFVSNLVTALATLPA